MFRGASNLSVDAKGRFALPKQHRTRLEEEGVTDLVVTIGMLEPCLLIYRLADWDALQAQIQELANADVYVRHVQRKMVGHATDVQLDSSGRILLPGELREHAHIDRKAKLLGMGKRFELWNPDTYRDHADRLEASYLSGEPQPQLPDVLQGLKV